MKKIILVCAAIAALAAMTACTKVNVSEETIVGNWHLQDNSTLPTVDVQILTDGYAHFNMGPGCFGEAITLSYRWTLTDSGNKVHFQYVYNSNGSEEQRPDKEWEVKEKDGGKLVVDERETQADYIGEPNCCTYIRQ